MHHLHSECGEHRCQIMPCNLNFTTLLSPSCIIRHRHCTHAVSCLASGTGAQPYPCHTSIRHTCQWRKRDDITAQVCCIHQSAVEESSVHTAEWSGRGTACTQAKVNVPTYQWPWLLVGCLKQKFHQCHVHVQVVYPLADRPCWHSISCQNPKTPGHKTLQHSGLKPTTIQP